MGDAGDSQDIEFWRSRALAAEQELEEHQETSAELEAELEKELKEKEEQLRSWQHKYNQLETENSREIERLQDSNQEHSTRGEHLERDNDELLKNNKFQMSCIRELEQSVDDLERTKREALHTICTLENELADQMEQCAILEADLEEKAKLETEVQRLRDQARDLSSDLMVERKKETRMKERECKMKTLLLANQISPGSYSSSPSTSLERLNRSMLNGSVGDETPKSSKSHLSSGLSPSVKRQPLNESASAVSTLQNASHANLTKQDITSNDGTDKENMVCEKTTAMPLAAEAEDPQTPEAKRKHISHTPPQSADRPVRQGNLQYTETHSTIRSTESQPGFSSSQRQSAVTLVGDLLNKIGVLENKLSSCRKFIRDSPWRETGVQRRKKSDNSGSGTSMNDHLDTRSNSTVNSEQYSPVQTRSGRQRRMYTDSKR